MIPHIDEPLALARIEWLPPEVGRSQGAPEPSYVYAATVAFAEESSGADYRDWRLGPHDLSILLEPGDGDARDWGRTKIGFIAPALAEPRVMAYEHFVVFEGRRPVALGQITVRLSFASPPQ